MGKDLPWILKALKEIPATKKIVVPLIHWLGMQKLELAANTPTWKTVWSAGQSVGLVNEILSCEKIIEKLVIEYEQTIGKLPK